MKRMLSLCAAALCLTLTLTPTALAADFEPAAPSAKVCYPTAIVRSEDGTELKKIYDLSPEDDPAGIPRSDFEQDGCRYTLIDLLKQELPENESRQHTEHISVESAKKDMESVLALLPQERKFITDDGLMGTLTLRLDTVQVEPSGYGTATKEISTKRSYPYGWQEHSYVACCGTSIQPVLERLRQNPKLDTVYLCLDNDDAGNDACDRMTDTLEDMGLEVERLCPVRKDWNDDLCAKFERKEN